MSPSSQSTVFSLAYVSNADDHLDKRAINTLFEHTVSQNEKLQISGFLVHGDSNFLQLLEGQKIEVLALFEKISKDQRHKDIQILMEQELPFRAFNNY